MIELTVKTLDSQNHAFSVPDDISVKQLKERIAESINFPVESQRLIYCGRVLQDEKNLSEYDVNGKVIHLVQRPPPQATRSNGGQHQSSTHQGRRGARPFRPPRYDGNAMYLGAMAFPADLMDAQGIQAPPSSHSLSDSRLLLARRMLRRASTVLHRLENPSNAETSDPDSTPEEPQDTASAAATTTSAEASFTAPVAATSGDIVASSATHTNSLNHNSGITNLQDVPDGLQPDLPLAQVTQAATAAAIAAAVSAAHAAGVPNITILRSGQSASDLVEMDGEVEIHRSEDSGANLGSGSEAPVPNSGVRSESIEAASTSGDVVENSESSTSTVQASNSNEEIPRTTVLADLLDELNRVNQRLLPYMQQYHTLMRQYPNPEESNMIEESQRVFGSVSEVMHFLSHAYHALSDIMCDFSQPSLRALRCRPVLIQHSAVLQAGIPIQAQINVMTNRNNANNNNNVNVGSSSSSSSGSGSQGTEQASEPVNTSEASEIPQDASNTSAPESGATASVNQEEVRSRENEAGFNITPGNVEFFMEVGPGSITIDSLEATVVTNSGNMGGDGLQANVVGGFPWGAPPPPEFIQNLMQAVAGHMIGRGGTNSSNVTTNHGATGPSAGAASSGQNSQARGNTATHPTTSTQTRSTSRPHVHLAPATMQGLVTSSFDPFLPCNSHHIRSRARQNVQSFTQRLAAAVGGATETQVSNDNENNAVDTAQLQSQNALGSQAAQSSGSGSVPLSSQSTTQMQTNSGNNSFSPQTCVPNQTSTNTSNTPTPSQNGSQGRRRQQSQQQQNQNQQQMQQQTTAGIFSMLSNIFGNMPPNGGGTTINLANLFQPMPQQYTPTSSNQTRNQSSSSQTTSGTSQTGVSNGVGTPFPSGMTFFNLGAQPRFSTHSSRQQQQSQPEQTFSQRAGNQSRETREPFSNPMLSQLLQGMSNIVGGELFNLGNMDGTLADFLVNDGEHGYRPGTSLFLDFLMIMARNMSFGDIISLSFGSGDSLNRIRPQLRQFIMEVAFENQPVNSESTSRVVEQVIREMRPQLQEMQQARLREDVDLVTSTIRYNQIRLPEVISLIVEGNEINFGQNLVRWFTRYIRDLSAIVLHCCLDGEQGLEQILRGYVTEVTRGIHPAVQVWTVNSSVSHMQAYVRRQNVPFDEIREYLVYRVHPVQNDSTDKKSSTSEATNTKTEVPLEPMDMDLSSDGTSVHNNLETGLGMVDDRSDRGSITPTGDEGTDDQLQDMPVAEANAAISIAASHPEMNISTKDIGAPKREPNSPLPTLTMDGEPLPDVVLGSEAWHNVLPSEWVPIIARDSQRQRRQSPQAPFSDAYLSGMPSKRRKVVTSTKPQGNLNQIITDSMRSALDEAGIRAVAGVETAGEDLELQAAYREQVRSAVQDSVTSNPDFTPERFPNATKYFSK